MKTRKKALLLLFSAVMLVTASVLGTMAYLTSQDEVVNTFTVGEVDIRLDEAEVKPDGTYVNGHDTRVEKNEYHLLPGHTYYKDPTVTVLKGSEHSYVRMLVTINEQADLDAIFAPDGLPLDTFFGGTSADWTLTKESENNDNTRTYEFRYKEMVAAPDEDVVLDDLFETITVPGDVTGDQLATIDELKIKVVAQAIQADGFKNADAAWAAFSTDDN